MPRAHPASVVQSVLDLKSLGWTDREVSAQTHVPVATIRLWRRRGLSRHANAELNPHEASPEPADKLAIATAAEHPDIYSYLLGVYLGDGAIRRWGAAWILRISLDVQYPGIIDSCCHAVEQLRGKRPEPKAEYGGKACVRIESTWKQWPRLFPQHGPGRKHKRAIELMPWQRAIVEQAPGPFLRGLIHTDGWRGVNRVHVKGKDYAYPRYQFSNRSDDIRKLFTDACDLMGVRWRPWTRYHVSVAQRESVALLDTVIGPKR
jgi:hypothetical protein